MEEDANDQTPDRFLEVYLLWLFRWVLFASQREIPCHGA
jgi:hypothetical protein